MVVKASHSSSPTKTVENMNQTINQQRAENNWTMCALLTEVLTHCSVTSGELGLYKHIEVWHLSLCKQAGCHTRPPLIQIITFIPVKYIVCCQLIYVDGNKGIISNKGHVYGI